MKLKLFGPTRHFSCLICLRDHFLLEKGKPSERAGRKATDLSPNSRDKAAGLPGVHSTTSGCDKPQPFSFKGGAMLTRGILPRPRCFKSYSLSLFTFLFTFTFLFILSSSLVFAGEIKLAWDPNTEPNLDGYKIYYGTSARTGADPKNCGTCGYSTAVTVGKVTEYTLGNLNTGQKYYVSLTATDTSNRESRFSIEVNGAAKDPTNPTAIQIPGKTTSSPELAWNPVANKLHIVVQGAHETSIWAGTFNSNGVFNNDWTLIPGKTASAPALAWNPVANKLHIVVRDANDSIWAGTFNSSGGFNNDWTLIPGKTASAPALAWNPVAKKLHIVVRDANNFSIWKGTFDSSGVFNNNWATLPGMTTPSSPGIAYLPSRGSLGVIVRDSNDSLWWGLY